MAETALHYDLKCIYGAEDDQRVEALIDGYRIDAVRRCGELVEVQHSPLGQIRDKCRKLLRRHRLRVVKPLLAAKYIRKRPAAGEPPGPARRSPKRATLVDVFRDLAHFTSVFPHERLTLELVMVEVDEIRVPGHGRRRRRRAGDVVIESQTLRTIAGVHELTTGSDLLALLPPGLPTPFHTADLAGGLGIRRDLAQKMAYTLRELRLVHPVGKRGNAVLYTIRNADEAAA